MDATLEILAERGRTFLIGEPITGIVRVNLPPGGRLGSIELRVERVVGSKTSVLATHECNVELVGPVEHDVPFSIPFPSGGFTHESTGINVELSLVAESRGVPAPFRWQLHGLSDLRVRLPGSDHFETAETRLPVIAVAGGGLSATTVVLGVGYLLALPFAALVTMVGIVAPIGAFIGWFAGAGDLAELHVDKHIRSARLELATANDERAVIATLTFETGSAPAVQSIDFRWIGFEERHWTSPKGRQHMTKLPFFAQNKVLAKEPDLAPDRTHQFDDSFVLPADATPSFNFGGEIVGWELEAVIELEGATTQRLVAPFVIAPGALGDLEVSRTRGASVVALERDASEA